MFDHNVARLEVAHVDSLHMIEHGAASMQDFAPVNREDGRS